MNNTSKPSDAAAVVDQIRQACAAHGLCDESKWAEGRAWAERIVDTILALTTKPFDKIAVAADHEMGMLIYMAVSDDYGVRTSIALTIESVPCITALVAGFLVYCNEERRIPARLDTSDIDELKGGHDGVAVVG